MELSTTYSLQGGSPVVLFALTILRIASLFAEPAAAQPFGGCRPY
uniref:Uncharacterized protein n=1 Tax=Arundo donax TaxID=35708 RepID=A0A0A9H1J0_ARUDO